MAYNCIPAVLLVMFIATEGLAHAADRTVRRSFRMQSPGQWDYVAFSFSVVATVPTKRSARTLAVDERTHLVYLPAADFEASADPKERPRMIAGSFKIPVTGKQ